MKKKIYNIINNNKLINLIKIYIYNLKPLILLFPKKR